MNHLYKRDLTNGSIAGSMLHFALPLMLGNLLQQCYNIADTLIVGQVLGAEALAAVGSSYALIVFITSIFIGLCMGCSAERHPTDETKYFLVPADRRRNDAPAQYLVASFPFTHHQDAANATRT